MKKVVLLIRVSTDKQETDSQREELIKFCLSEGYQEDEMIIIENKESGSKQIVTKGLTELKQAINDYPIERVYIWELSRLSRIPRVLEDMRNLFVDNKINLISKQDNLKLLDENGEINFITSIHFDVIKSIVEGETKIRNERIARGKEVLKEKHKFMGGHLTYGYDKKGEKYKDFIVNEEQAKVVREIFYLYSTGKYSMPQIKKEMESRGIEINVQIQKILSNEAYTGEIFKSRKSDTMLKYPHIIRKELFKECEKIRISKANRTSDKSKNIYYAGRLIKCSNCGNTLVANKSTGNYRCRHHVVLKTCDKGDMININVADSLALHEAYLMELVETKEDREKKIKEYTEKIQELQEKIYVAEKNIDKRKEKIKNKIKKALSYLSEKELNSHVDRQIKEEAPALKKKIAEWKVQIQSMESIIKENKSWEDAVIKPNTAATFFINYQEAFLVKNFIYRSLLELGEQQRYDMVHRYIRKISVKADKTKPQIKKISISKYPIIPPKQMLDNNYIAWNSADDSVYYYDTKAINKGKKLYQIINKQLNIPINEKEKLYQLRKLGVKFYFNNSTKTYQSIEEKVKVYLKWDDYIIEHIAKRIQNKAI
jgi:DNA invertase Pin-like site-specific DNA recombinase